MRLLYHRQVQDDLFDAMDYYREWSDRAAESFFEEFEQVIGEIQRDPASFRPISERFRRYNFKKYPYHILFEIDRDLILITVLRHHKRHPSFGLRRRW